MAHGNSFAGACVLALAALGAACSSTNPYEVNRELLAAAEKSLAAEDSRAAAAAAERLYAGRAEEADRFRLQRWFALYLAANAHVQAATHTPFLGEDAAASQVGAPRGNDVPHLVAATYYAGLARDLAPGAKQDKPVVDETRLLTPALEATGFENARQKLDVVRLIALTRLGFASSATSEMEGFSALHQAESCDELVGRIGLEKELVPWVYYTAFRYLEDRDDRGAYTFGAKARLAAAETKGAMPAERLDEVVAWVRAKSQQDKLEFCCQMCRKPFPYDKLRCMDDSTPITTFFPMKREN